MKALIISFASMPNNMITFYIFREMFKAGDDLKRKLTILKQKLVDQTATGIKSKVTVTEQNPLTGSPKKKKKKDPNAINIVGGTTPEDDMKVEEELKLAEEEDDAYAKDSEDDWEEHLHTDHTGTSKIDISIISAMHEDGEATDNNFEDAMYSNLDKSNPGNKISLRHTDEMIECYVYNDFNWMAFTYSDIMSNKRRMRNFQVDDEMATEIIGPKAAFEKGIAKAFFKRPNSPELWKKDRGHREFVGGQFCWHKDENRGNAKNVWHELKKLLGKLSRDPKITGGKFHEYDTINVAHLLVFCNLIGFKIRVNDPEWNPASSDEWVLFLADLDNLMNGLETFSFIKGILIYIYAFHRSFRHEVQQTSDNEVHRAVAWCTNK